jgi:hypothetical protein
LAGPAGNQQTGSVLLGADPADPPACMALSATDINALAPLRAAGITDRCLTVVHRGAAALPSGTPATIDRAVRTLEHLLI